MIETKNHSEIETGKTLRLENVILMRRKVTQLQIQSELMKLTKSELMEIEGENWKKHTSNVLTSSIGAATVGGLLFGPPGAVIGAHYGAIAYAVGYAVNKK